jgi:hypothetical protein
MLREALAMFLGLFLAFTEVFNFKELEAPALNVEYSPQVRKKSAVQKMSVRASTCQSGRMP